MFQVEAEDLVRGCRAVAVAGKGGRKQMATVKLCIVPQPCFPPESLTSALFFTFITSVDHDHGCASRERCGCQLQLHPLVGGRCLQRHTYRRCEQVVRQDLEEDNRLVVARPADEETGTR